MCREANTIEGVLNSQIGIPSQFSEFRLNSACVRSDAPSLRTRRLRTLEMPRFENSKRDDTRERSRGVSDLKRSRRAAQKCSSLWSSWLFQSASLRIGLETTERGSFKIENAGDAWRYFTYKYLHGVARRPPTGFHRPISNDRECAGTPRDTRAYLRALDSSKSHETSSITLRNSTDFFSYDHFLKRAQMRLKRERRKRRTSGGFQHVLFNSLVGLLLGVPIEFVHGSWRTLGVLNGNFGRVRYFRGVKHIESRGAAQKKTIEKSHSSRTRDLRSRVR